VSSTNPTLAFTLTGAGANGITAYSRLHDVVDIADAYRNQIEIGSVTGSTITGFVVDINGGGNANESPASDNRVTISQSTLNWQNGDVSISGAGAQNNLVHDGWFHGPTFQPKVFWLQYVGATTKPALNEIARVKSDSPSGYPWCDQNDLSNKIDDVYATLTMPRTTATAYGQTQWSFYCNVSRVTSNAINTFLALGGDFAVSNATSSGNLAVLAQGSPGGGPEVGDSFHTRVHTLISGNAGAKTGNASYWCNSINWTIPSDATGDAEIDLDCQHPVVNGTYCTVTVISNSSTATPPASSTSSCAFGAKFGAGFQYNATSGSDLMITGSATMTPYAPTWQGKAFRP